VSVSFDCLSELLEGSVNSITTEDDVEEDVGIAIGIEFRLGVGRPGVFRFGTSS